MGQDQVDRAPHSLYIHVPFCVSKCPYCDFNSHIGLEGLFETYNHALVAEIRTWGRELGGTRIDTIFIGGGTPSRVPSAHIAAVLRTVGGVSTWPIRCEVTLEANPQSADGDKLDAWLAAGVNRLSLGFQSLDAPTLAFLERAHDAAEAIGVFGRARQAGFTNISCDLIFAVPGLSSPRWKGVIEEVLALSPDHLSAYELTPEMGTRLGADVASGRTVMPDEDLRLEQYEVAAELLGRAGFSRYEVSNWALPGRQCRHNIAYWSGVPYAAAGAGAHAFLFAETAPSWLSQTRPPAAVTARQWNRAQPAAYIAAVRRQGQAIAGHEWLEVETAIGDLVMMGLRRERGIDLAASSRLYGVDVGAAIAPSVERLSAIGLLELAGDHVRATARGLMVLNRVVSKVGFSQALVSLALRYFEC